MQTKVIEKNNKQRRCGRVGEGLDQVSLFFRRNKSGGFFFGVQYCSRWTRQYKSRCARFDLHAFYSNLNRKLWARAFCIMYACMSCACGSPPVNTHTYTYAHTHSGVATLCLWLFFPGLLPLGPRTPARNIYVCVNWTLGIDVMRRKIKIRKMGRVNFGCAS